MTADERADSVVKRFERLPANETPLTHEWLRLAIRSALVEHARGETNEARLCMYDEARRRQKAEKELSTLMKANLELQSLLRELVDLDAHLTRAPSLPQSFLTRGHKDRILTALKRTLGALEGGS